MITKEHMAMITAAVRESGEIRPVLRGVVARIATARGYVAPVWDDGEPVAADGLGALGDEVAYWTCEELGEVYQRLLAKDRRLKDGVFYTPARVARWMVINATKTQLGPDRDVSRLAVCDPACGAGIFLALTAGHLACLAAAAADESDPDEQVLAAWVAEHADQCVYGVDTDPVAVDLTKAGLWLEAAGRRPITWLDDNVICGNTLHGDLPPALDKRLTDDDALPIVIGNPPFADKAKGAAPWIEAPGHGDEEIIPRPALDDFRDARYARMGYVLNSLAIYFWRWALWLTLDQRPGTVALLTPNAYMRTNSFAGMRTYLRQCADRGWFIDISPEGHRAPKAGRFFPEIATPLCIGIVARTGHADHETPAVMKFASLGDEREPGGAA